MKVYNVKNKAQNNSFINFGDVLPFYIYEKINDKKLKYVVPEKTYEDVYLFCGSISVCLDRLIRISCQTN